MIYLRPYIAENAIAYAQRWALDRNPLFSNYTGVGGDCTNFVSQCVLAGCCTMNFTPDFGWYYISDSDRAPAWTGVEYFYDFFTGAADFTAENGGIGPYGTVIPKESVRAGDIVQLSNELGDFYHTLFVYRVENGEIFVAAHSDDALDRPLSSYNYQTDRFIRVLGARATTDTDCFINLIEGISLPIPQKTATEETPEAEGEEPTA